MPAGDVKSLSPSILAAFSMAVARSRPQRRAAATASPRALGDRNPLSPGGMDRSSSQVSQGPSAPWMDARRAAATMTSQGRPRSTDSTTAASRRPTTSCGSRTPGQFSPGGHGRWVNSGSRGGSVLPSTEEAAAPPPCSLTHGHPARYTCPWTFSLLGGGRYLTVSIRILLPSGGERHSADRGRPNGGTAGEGARGRPCGRQTP